MKIAIMAAWNTTSGVCMHSEPIGKAFIEMGHDVTVFTFRKDDYHGDGITAEDEDYVIRCFGTRPNTNSLDPRPFVDTDYEILLVEDIGMLPVDKLADLITGVIRKKAKILHVVHENRPCEHSWFYKIGWDKVVYFDERQEFLKKVDPDAVFIPFPCYPHRKGDKEEARRKLDLPLDKRIVYSFAHRGYDLFYRELSQELRNDTVLLHVIPDCYGEIMEEGSATEGKIVRREVVVTTERFDDYLFASDAVVLHKFQSREHAVISTTALQAIGTGCPVFVPKQSDFFHCFDKEIIHYESSADLDKQLVDVLGNESTRNELSKHARAFVETHSPREIAERFIEIFHQLLKD